MPASSSLMNNDNIDEIIGYFNAVNDYTTFQHFLSKKKILQN
jgi:hypothetical protein